jgi:hypothetical protein
VPARPSRFLLKPATLGAFALLFIATQALSQQGAAPKGPPPAGTGAPAAGTGAPAGTATPGGATPAQPVTDPGLGGTGPSGPGGVGTASEGTHHKTKKGPPDPTPEQLAVLAELQKEADAYARDAKDYRATLTRIIKHHYEEKKRRMLSAINRELATESDSLKAARERAIQELEGFVARYSKPNDHPEATPDAMFRLAALYEERDREKVDEIEIAPGVAPPLPDLNQAIALYKRIVVDFPQYKELAAVFYYLGHALADMSRIDESQQVWRSLVCHNHYGYPVPPDPADPNKDSITRMPQDHDPDWWLGWMQRHPEPRGTPRPPAGMRVPTKKPKGPVQPEQTATGDEDTFADPFPSDCAPIPQQTAEGDDPRYLAEVWWRIGDFHFDEVDPYGGPYNLNRGERAYRQAMQFKKPPVYDVSMYKLAWTFYKQQRYHQAVDQFVELLKLTDDREAETGNPHADFRSEAFAYIAGSLTYIDFDGPGPDDPYIARPDVFDLFSDAGQVEEKMHIAIDRVQDPALIPQDKKWTIEIYKALAFEFREYNHFHNLVELNELILAKWPLHRDAPEIQNQIAETYEQLAAMSQGAEHERFAKLALDARGKLINYVATPDKPTNPWLEANKDDPEAIRRAEKLVKGGLRRAAADHTNAARRFVQIARGAEGAAQKEAFDAALREYRLAYGAWGGYLLQDENAEDAYESRFWLADAYTNAVLIQIELGQTPDQKELGLAQQTAREVRDSNEDDKFLQPAAIMLVRIAQQVVKQQYQLFDDTHGAQGLEKREALKEVGEGDDKKFVTDPIPKPLVEMMGAFDEYNARVPLDVEPEPANPNQFRFAYLAGEIPFLYGHFADARTRLWPIYQQQCGSTEYGYLAWEKLLTMANKENNFEESKKLADAADPSKGGKSCAVSEVAKAKEKELAGLTRERGYYQAAADAYTKAQNMPDGPERKAQWRKAAELYEEALKQAPGRKEAPEAAILGASAWKQIGEYDHAIAMYELFIKEYGSEERLAVLEHGDPKAKPPVTANPKELKDRVDNLKTAYDALAEAYVLFFDYPKAAQTYEKIATVDRFEDAKQREAARNAVFLYANIGDRAKMDAARSKFFSMQPAPTAEERAEVDWLVATADLKQWDENSPDRGPNKDARAKALTAMDKYYRNYQGDKAASAYVVQAAYQTAKMRRAGGDDTGFADYCKKTITAFDSYKSSAGNDEKGHNKALGSAQADMAAECDYRAIDEELKRAFDYDAGFHRYAGVITDARKAFKDDVEVKAKGYFDRLQAIISKYESRRWAVAARARQGSLYDSCRTGLYNAREPGLKLYNDKEEKLLKQLDDLCVNQGSEDACIKHDEFQAKRRADWTKQRDEDLASADKAMVAGYAEAILWAKSWKVRVDAVDNAIARLAFFTEIIGDAKLREYTSPLQDPATKSPFKYQDGMFVRMRRGMVTKVEPQVVPSPLPALPTP